MKRPEPSALYHYSCHHGASAIGERGIVLPSGMHAPEAVERMPEELKWLTNYAWFTDLSQPLPGQLGLTRMLIDCDRLAHRFVVKPDEMEKCIWWPDEMKRLNLRAARRISLAPGAMPAHWWVATGPIRAEGLPWVNAS